MLGICEIFILKILQICAFNRTLMNRSCTSHKAILMFEIWSFGLTPRILSWQCEMKWKWFTLETVCDISKKSPWQLYKYQESGKIQFAPVHVSSPSEFPSIKSWTHVRLCSLQRDEMSNVINNWAAQSKDLRTGEKYSFLSLKNVLPRQPFNKLLNRTLNLFQVPSC